MSDDELFLTAILDCKRSDIVLEKPSLTEDQRKRFNDMKSRRENGEPVQYIVGFTEFMGLRMDVGPGVLIPRPETEILVDETVLDLSRDKKDSYRIFEVGTGSGCIAIALAKMLKNASVVSVDISAQALEYAKCNASLNCVSERIEFIENDVFSFVQGCQETFDVMISNPPYIPTVQLDSLPEDVKQEPTLALDGGPDGLNFYRFLIPVAKRLLKPGGLLSLEFGDGEKKDLEKLFAQTGGWDRITFWNDYVLMPRGILARKK